MKKFIALLLALTLVLTIVGCNKTDDKVDEGTTTPDAVDAPAETPVENTPDAEDVDWAG
jgi:uncharacterized lipoprotein NlpE involved in copper resistance